MIEAVAVVVVEVKVSTIEIISVATISHDKRTCWDEDVGGDAESRQQQGSRHAGPPPDDLEEQIGHDLGWHLDGRVDEVCEKHVEAEPSDVQADPVVGDGDANPANQRNQRERMKGGWGRRNR